MPAFITLTQAYPVQGHTLCSLESPNSNIWAGKKQSCAEVWFILPQKKYTLLIYFLLCTFLFGKWDVKHPQVPSGLKLNTPTTETMVRFHCVNSHYGSTATKTVRYLQSDGSQTRSVACGIDFPAVLRAISTNETKVWKRVCFFVYVCTYLVYNRGSWSGQMRSFVIKQLPVSVS